ncbi:hypothetical protein [Chitinophaga arvensicola]|uniref:hypothetical protein n=1 Tax=Chitinophaga arvensicola TaxID=29529 RepID=UPI000B7F6943|nr:hypothetical protein [Chitinophaga arvensicola]
MKLYCTILLLLWPFAVVAQSGGPVLQAGTVRVSGEVTIPVAIKKDSVWLFLKVPYPFTGEVALYKTLLDTSGHFVLKVNTEVNVNRCAVSTDIDINNQVIVFLKNGRENNISFKYGNDGVINKITTSDNAGFTEEELITSLDKFNDMINERSNKPVSPLYNKDYSAFIDHTNHVLDRKRGLLNQPPLLSERMKDIVFKDYWLAVYYNHVFDYRTEMVLNYRNTNNHKMPDSAVIKHPVRGDYSFLKDLDLNNPLYLYCFSYPTFTQELLRNSVLNIPRIGDTPVREWTKTIKGILGQLMGSDQGLFYDMLISNAYAMQFELELAALTAKQIRNIKDYCKGGDLEKILPQETRTSSKCPN